MNALEAAIYGYLDAQLTAPVFLHEAPQEQQGPYVVFGVDERSETPGTAPLITADIETAIVATVHDDAESLAMSVRTALLGWRYGAPGVRLGPVILANVNNSFDSTWQRYTVLVSWATQALIY
jgi:hypothetical protein